MKKRKNPPKLIKYVYIKKISAGKSVTLLPDYGLAA
jgi:hypothetical protein